MHFRGSENWFDCSVPRQLIVSLTVPVTCDILVSLEVGGLTPDFAPDFQTHLTVVSPQAMDRPTEFRSLSMATIRPQLSRKSAMFGRSGGNRWNSRCFERICRKNRSDDISENLREKDEVPWISIENLQAATSLSVRNSWMQCFCHPMGLFKTFRGKFRPTWPNTGQNSWPPWVQPCANEFWRTHRHLHLGACNFDWRSFLGVFLGCHISLDPSDGRSAHPVDVEKWTPRTKGSCLSNGQFQNDTLKYWLVVSTPPNNISQLGLLFRIWKNKESSKPGPPTSVYLYRLLSCSTLRIIGTLECVLYTETGCEWRSGAVPVMIMDLGDLSPPCSSRVPSLYAFPHMAKWRN